MIKKIIRHELHGIGGEFTHIYVTARRGYATPGNPLNRPGWHSDGFGTSDVNYVWTDRYPTLFAEQPFEQISADHVDSVRQFAEQVDPARIRTYPDKTLMRLDPSVIHAAPEIPAPGGRGRSSRCRSRTRGTTCAATAATISSTMTGRCTTERQSGTTPRTLGRTEGRRDDDPLHIRECDAAGGGRRSPRAGSRGGNADRRGPVVGRRNGPGG